MEKKPVSANQRIEAMSRGLRNDPMQQAPEEVILRVLSAPQPKAVSPARITLRVGFAFALAGMAAFAMWPRESEANMLDRVVNALNSEPFVHTRVYKWDIKGMYVLDIERYQRGEDNRMIWYSQGGERTTFNGRCTVYNKSLPYALIEKAERSPGVPELEHLLTSKPGAKLMGKSSVKWRGKPADRYLLKYRENMIEKIVDVKLSLYADPRTHRPLCLEVDLVGMDKTRWTWDYPRLDTKLLRPNVPKGVPIFDLDAQRKSLTRAVWRGGDIKRVGGIQVQFRAAIYDMSNEELMVITTGGEGRVHQDPHVLKVEGLPSGMERLTPLSGVTQAPAGYIANGTYWEGLRLLVEDVKFPKGTRIPERFKVSVPVWKKDDSRNGRSFAGYAVFEVKKPFRTSRIEDLVYPQNVVVFDLANSGGWKK